MKPYQGVNFLYQHFLTAAKKTPQNYFRAGFQKRFSPGVTIRGTLTRYLQLQDWDMVHDLGLRSCPPNKDLGGLIAKEYGDSTA